MQANNVEVDADMTIRIADWRIFADKTPSQAEEREAMYREVETFTCPQCKSVARAGELACSVCNVVFSSVGKTEKLGANSDIKMPKSWPTGEVIVDGRKTITFDIEGVLPVTFTISDLVIIGRYNDVVTPNEPDVDLNPYGGREKGVSRQHLKITRKGILLYVTDLGSTNGTMLNGRRLFPHTERLLRDGDELHIGHLRVGVRF